MKTFSKAKSLTSHKDEAVLLATHGILLGSFFGAARSGGYAMSKVDVYFGGYLELHEIGSHESDTLRSNECVIGMPLVISYDAQSGTFDVATGAGSHVGVIRPQNRLSMREALENNWTCKCWLSLVYYVEAEHTYHGEVVYQIYNLKPSQTAEQAALDTFAQGISTALANGERPRVALNGKQYDEVIATGGTWKPEGTEALPFSTARGSGVVVYKQKRSFAEHLIAGIVDRRPAYVFGTLAGLVVIILLVLFFIWSCTQG